MFGQKQTQRAIEILLALLSVGSWCWRERYHAPMSESPAAAEAPATLPENMEIILMRLERLTLGPVTNTRRGGWRR